MPYVITTTTPEMADHLTPGQPWPRTVSRLAVATLDEAIAAANAAVYAQEEAVHCALSDFRDACDLLPESGGTVGPLPDGTVIGVRPADYGELATYIDDPAVHQNWEIIVAYNAAQEVTR